ncbi:MAG: type II secretion system F family protein [Chloroflexota bacterium]|nr:type II secretion system F family protein [Chloroflexota bacterium]
MSLQKRIAKAFSEGITSFDLFYQLTHMSATSAAGISRDRVFLLARELQCPSAQYFRDIHLLVDSMRYNYPDACRMIGENVDGEETKNFLLRLSDALRSGEPLPSFLAREAEVQGKNYSNEYERNLESLKKWNDGYVAVTVSVALIVIINMVSTMIYDMGTTTMLMMVMMAGVAGFGVAWVISRSAPQEVKNMPLKEGSREHQLALKLSRILVPVTVVAIIVLVLLEVDVGWIMIVASILMVPIGIVIMVAENKVGKKDKEVSAFLRSIGGTATSRGTTLRDALANIKIDSFPTLEPDIHRLGLRLNAFAKPGICWRMFGAETGSKLIDRTIGIFYEAVNLGGDPEQAGLLASLFAMRTSMLRAKRDGVAATFTYLVIVMHGVLAALMTFLLGILSQFVVMLETAMMSAEQGEAMQAAPASLNVLPFSLPQISFLRQITVGTVIILAMTNAFAMVSSEGSHLLKMFLYLSILLLLSGVSLLTVPSLVQLVM